MGRLESYEVLKKLFWMSKAGKFDLSDVELVVADRSAVGGVRTVKLSSSAVLMRDRIVMPDTDIQIPMHRVIEIRASGESLWKRGRSAQTKF